MKYSVGVFNPAVVVVTNRQGFTEFVVESGFIRGTHEVMDAVAGAWNSQYESTPKLKKDKIAKLNEKLVKAKNEVDRIEHAIRAIRKNKWIEVK